MKLKGECEKMITILKQIKGHNKIETLEIMLKVIEILEKNYAHDDRMSNEDWLTMFLWLEKYYCELKEMFIKEGGY